MNKSFVYFVMHERHAEIRVGFTGPDDLHFKRLKQHEAYGFRGAKALVPGSSDDEDATHKLLEPFLVSSKSIYRLDDAVVEYFEALLMLGRAAPTTEEARTWPALPFELWRFGSPALRFIEPDGQPSLFRAAPQRDRLVYAHNLAILQSKGDEWFTPSDLVERARRVMGGIDLDPASSPIANRTILAHTYYTKAMNGLNLALPWRGRLWVNPPYGRGPDSAGAFVGRLMSEWKAGKVSEAVTCLNLNSMSSDWFRPLHDSAAALAIVFGRPSYQPPEDVSESSPTKGTVLSYLGSNVDGFANAYGDIGAIYTRFGAVPASDLIGSAECSLRSP